MFATQKGAYTSVPEEEDAADLESPSFVSSSRRQKRKSGTIAVLVVVIVLLATWNAALTLPHLGYVHSTAPTSHNFSGLEALPTVERAQLWLSKYSDGSSSSIQTAWDAVDPDHGVVALDMEWARRRGLPETAKFPDDPDNKGVYILEAYHQIHCLKILQLSYNELLRGQPLTWEKEHPVHCLDSLRQYVMCNADDTPLYTWGRNITGDGQARQCKDWGVLREWAKEHTACYKQTAEPLTFRQRFGRCNDGGDGLEDLAPYASVQGG